MASAVDLLELRVGGLDRILGALPFDRSGSDLTAHAMRALNAWNHTLTASGITDPKIAPSIFRGWRYLQKHQRSDGSWLPLWFGNQDDSEETNPIYGTARVLMAVFDCGHQQSEAALQAIEFLQASQNTDGGWGGGPSIRYSIADNPAGHTSTIEETAQALEVLARCMRPDTPLM